jgi:hypothetical protein
MIDIHDIRQGVRLGHNNKHTKALLCGSCVDHALCGGLHVKEPMMSCLDHCNCKDKEKCSFTCPKNPHYAKRMIEVGGFDFDEIQKLPKNTGCVPPRVVSGLFTAPKITGPLQIEWAAIPLSKAYTSNGRSGRFLTRAEVCRKFRIHPSTKIILTGVDKDSKLEKWWRISENRPSLMKSLRELSPELVTVPNFSSFRDVPRHENLYNMKRGALCWEELHQTGIQTAYHINCLTERDYERTLQFLTLHDEITNLSVEYTTGCAVKDRAEYHLGLLKELLEKLCRPVTIVYRGEIKWAREISEIAGNIVVINTNAAMRTRNRRKATISKEGKLTWLSAYTSKEQMLDDLLQHNVATSNLYLQKQLLEVKSTEQRQPPVHTVNKYLELYAEANDHPLQMSLI